MCFVFASFSQCSSTKQASQKTMYKTQEKSSFTLDKTYYQHWIAGVKGGGSGIHMYISVLTNKNNVVFDSVYFRGMQSKLELGKMGYIASFKTEANQKADIIMSNEKNAEYANQIPNQEVRFPFELNEKECIISYIEDNTTKYFKIQNLLEKARQEYPSAPPKH